MAKKEASMNQEEAAFYFEDIEMNFSGYVKRTFSYKAEIDNKVVFLNFHCNDDIYSDVFTPNERFRRGLQFTNFACGIINNKNDKDHNKEFYVFSVDQ